MTPEQRAEDLVRLSRRNGITAVDLRDAIASQIREAEEDAYEEANGDFNWLQSAVAKIYCHFTDNKLSKWNYDPDVVISEIEDCQNQFWEKEIEKAKAEGERSAYEDAAKIAKGFKDHFAFSPITETPLNDVDFDILERVGNEIANMIQTQAKGINKYP